MKKWQNILLKNAIILFVLSSCDTKKKRDFFTSMPDKYIYDNTLIKNTNNLIINNGLSFDSKKINGKDYYSLFQNEEYFTSFIAGYIRKENKLIYRIPFLNKTKESVVFDFNSKVNDTLTYEYEEQSRVSLILMNIKETSVDTIYTYKVLLPNNCEDCAKITFFSISTRLGFNKLYIQSILGDYELKLNSDNSTLNKVNLR